ncbi:MAG: hypothetical protein Kow0031_19730 [Anaerolineae bacterium]
MKLPLTSFREQDAAPPRLNLRAGGQALLTAVGLLALFGALWAAIVFSSPNLTGNDDYFHIRFAQVMRQQGLTPPFPWLPLTILNPAEYSDHHFLYHVLLMPFAGGNLIAGAKGSAAVFGSLAFLMGWWLLRGQRVPFAALWALGFFAMSEAFLHRLSMIRVQAVSLLLLLLALHLLIAPGEKQPTRHRLLLPLAFAYTWLYDAFPLLLAIITIYVLAMWLFERQLLPRPLLYAALGVALGLLVNPYFPHNVEFIIHHYLPKITDITAAGINVGNEWYPYQTWTLVRNSGPALAALMAGALALGLRERRMDGVTAALFFIALFFLALLLKSRRFVEYYPAFALIFCAVAWKPLLGGEEGERGDTPHAPRPAARGVFLLLAMLLPLLTAYNLLQTRAELSDSRPHQRFAAASAWLVANSPPGSRVFNTDWDDFSPLFFHNTHNVYMLGLDPTYMHLRDPALYRLWRDTTQGWGNIGPVIRDEFEAGYAITDLDHQGFIDKAASDPYLAEVYRDEFAIIYRVLTEPDPTKKGWYDNEPAAD